MKTRAWCVVFIGIVGVGCTKPSGTPSNEPTVKVGGTTSTLPFDHPPVDFGTGGGAGGGGGGTGGGTGGGAGGGGGGSSTSTSSGAQRLSIAQMAASLPAILGTDETGQPITWKIGADDAFGKLSATLGEPDYINVTSENLEPSPLYAKFMTDMARDACNRVIAADATRTDQNKRVTQRFVSLTDTVATNASGVDENLRYLKLRFQGIKVAPTDEAPIKALRTAFDAAVKGAAGPGAITEAHVREGWRTVCVALMTSPEFHLY